MADLLLRGVRAMKINVRLASSSQQRSRLKLDQSRIRARVQESLQSRHRGTNERTDVTGNAKHARDPEKR